MKWLFYISFAAGAGLVWGTLLLPLVRSRRDPIRALIERFRQIKPAGAELPITPMSPKELQFLERARLSGVTWSYRAYRQLRLGMAAAGCYLSLAVLLPGIGAFGRVSLYEVVRLLVISGFAGFALWNAPIWLMSVLAAQRRGRCLAEISKFSHRLAICVTDKNDIREMILRAGRPLRILKPHIQKLAAQWGKDQREAIMDFKDAVGISEVYPLVNAFMAISTAKSADVSRILLEHSKSIDSTLEAEMNKRIENAPLWISFYIMIPFFVCLFLFVYPWVLTVLEQLTVSFSAN
ncbi:hypothetical protein [Paenibacillus thermotolerans]|uniref:hypothetical protein n=1 Tax=Paenibacillus thermotolerans TaxID=3027807 RepID=UPI0023676E5D|nr:MULTISPECIES: hypothetical protein [unclassified Paenibacillus]